MKKSRFNKHTFHDGKPKPAQPVPIRMAADNVLLTWDNAAKLLGVLAGIIEEPYCAVGRVELEGCVRGFRALSRAMGFNSSDYAFVNGAAVSARDRAQVLKLPVDGAPGECLQQDGELSGSQPGPEREAA